MRNHAPVAIRLLPACFRSPLMWCVVGLWFALTASALTVAIPESRRELSAAERQRIRYLNSALWQQAHDYIGQANYVSAREALTAILANDPDHNHARVLLINVHNHLREYDRARELADDLIAHYPDAPELYLERATIDIRDARRESALVDLERFTAGAKPDHPRMTDAVRTRARALLQLRRFDEAAALARELVERNDTAQDRLLLAECALQQENFDAAVTELERARQLTDDADARESVLARLSVAYFHLERFDEAEAALADTREQSPEILRQRGWIAYRAGRFDTAASFFGTYLDESAFDETIALARLDALQKAESWSRATQVGRAYADRDDVSEKFRADVMRRLLNGYELLDDLDTVIAEYEAHLARAFSAEAALGYQYVLRRKAADMSAEGRGAGEVEALLARVVPYLEQVLASDEVDAANRRTVRYELAQVKRELGDEAGYEALMAQLAVDAPDSRVLHEYAMRLQAAGRHQEAVPLFEQAAEQETDAQALYAIHMALADIHLLQNNADEAVRWLERSKAAGRTGRDWYLKRVRAEFLREEYDAALHYLMVSGGGDDFLLLTAFAFNNRSPAMPGLALTFMNRVADPVALSPDEQFTFFANRAYLNYDQLRDAEALTDVERALALRPSVELEQVRLRALLRSGDLEGVLERGATLVDREDLEPSVAAGVREIMGLAAYRLERWRDAIAHFSDALEHDPLWHQSRYHRGLAFMEEGEEEAAQEDLLALAPYAYEFPSTFWGDLGFILGGLKEFEEGIEWLDRSLAMYPYDIDGWQERGYQSMKDHRNKAAKESFEEAILIYDEILPYVEEEEGAEVIREIRMSLKQEYTKLDKVWSFQLYAQRTDFDFDESDLPADAPGDSTQGALQSQGGVMIGYRPPKMGFRNERTFDVFLRVMANLESGSWRPDSDSYQGGLGIMYKPFVRHNYVFGFERLFKIGDNAEDNWLWRNTYGIEGGERPLRHQDIRLYRRFYAEASYYLESPSRWVFFGQGNIGPSFRLTENLLLTIPEGLAVARYQDNDPEGIGTYWYYGPGLNIRLLEGERALTRDRWALAAYAHYVWGRFDKAPENMRNNDFEGWIVGINLTR